ncbi:MAG: PIG-L family deacetylase [Candidatus Omnitrophica bacterium]|nr:PIG-L family deacetylase [Candidatus Omnitrophota bacterium]
MRRIIFIIFIFSAILSSTSIIADTISPKAQIFELEPFKKGERVLIFAPHPDDETIGCAGVIQHALKAGAEIKVVYLTNGDHNQLAFIVYEKRLTLRKGEFLHMGEVRRKEAVAAMKLLGLKENNLVFLGYPDFGTLAIFNRYWQSLKPFKSLLTRVTSVPYKNNYSYGSPYTGESILKDFKQIIQDYKPDKIFVSHPADTNGDHKACYLFCEVALWELKDKIPVPKVYPYLVHHAGWPLPRHYHPEMSLTPPENLLSQDLSWYDLGLSPDEVEQKHKAMLCYKSQTKSSAFYLLSFVRRNELFSKYSEITLSRQMSLKEKAISFLGFSKMYSDSESASLGRLDDLVDDQGQVSYAVVDNNLLVRVEKEENISRRFKVALLLFGFSNKTPFEKMPKIRILTQYNQVKIINKGRVVPSTGVSVEVNKHALILRLPLELLGNPDFILTSLRAYGGKVPVDATAFRKIEIK